MTDSPTIHHRATLRRRLGTAGGCPALEPHQRGAAAGCSAAPPDGTARWPHGAGEAAVLPPAPVVFERCVGGGRFCSSPPPSGSSPSSPLKGREKAPPAPPLCSASPAITGSPHPLTPAQAAHRLLMQWRLARTGSLCGVLRWPSGHGGRAGGSRRTAERSPARTAFRRKGGA